MTVLNISIVAIIVATVAHQAIGFVWYGALFGKTWAEARGVEPGQMGADANQALMISTVCALVMSIALAMIHSAASAQGLVSGITLGAICGVGLVSASAVLSGTYEAKPMRVTQLLVGYETIALIVMGAIIGALS